MRIGVRKERESERETRPWGRPWGLLPHVKPYFMMSCCSREVGCDTCREDTPLDLSMCGGGGCNAKELGQEQLCSAIRLTTRTQTGRITVEGMCRLSLISTLK